MPYTLPQPQYDVLIQRDVPIPMRDGASLITDIYRPSKGEQAASGKFPVILVRTCYDKDVPIKFFAGPDYYVPRGYVVVIQDTRGRY
jgi:predicted acyl esterase